MKWKMEEVGGKKMKILNNKFKDVPDGWYKVEMSIWSCTVLLYVGKWENLKPSAREAFALGDDKNALELIETWGRNQSEQAKSGTISGGDYCIIRMEKFCPNIIGDIIDLMHESLHASQRMLSRVGAEVDPTGSEVLAYTHGHLFHELFMALSEGKRKEK